MKVSKKVFLALNGIIVGLVMSFALSFIMISASVGFIEGFVIIWLKSFGLSFLLSTPIAMIAFPFIEKRLLQFFVIEN